MFDFHEKRKIKSWVYSNLSIGVLVVLIAFMFVSVFERYQKERETAEKRVERTADLHELEARAAALEAKVEEAESVRGMEAEIRNRYDVAKEGEEVVIIIDEKSDGQESTTRVQEEPEVTEDSFLDVLKFW